MTPENKEVRDRTLKRPSQPSSFRESCSILSFSLWTSSSLVGGRIVGGLLPSNFPIIVLYGTGSTSNLRINPYFTTRRDGDPFDFMMTQGCILIATSKRWAQVGRMRPRIRLHIVTCITTKPRRPGRQSPPVSRSRGLQSWQVDPRRNRPSARSRHKRALPHNQVHYLTHIPTIFPHYETSIASAAAVASPLAGAAASSRLISGAICACGCARTTSLSASFCSGARCAA
jgi:hypothetical protein